MITNEEARARVARGAAHLDQVRPGWFNRIDVGTLSLGSCWDCVIGQLFGVGRGIDDPIPFAAGLDALGWNETYTENGVGGFMDPEQIRLTQDAWIEAIADRRLSTTPNGTPDGDAVPVRPTVEMNVSAR